jgi:hypothetical protein
MMTDNQEHNQENKQSQTNESERVFETHADEFHLKVEGLKDGYRVTFNMDETTVKNQRRAFASFIQFAKLSEKAGWRVPWPIRLLLAIWAKYKKVE